MNWTAVEDAIMAWAKNAGGFATGFALWSAQTGPRPTNTFLEIKLDGPIRLPGVERLKKFEPAAPAGQEMSLIVKGQRQVVARLTVFDGDATGGASSRAILSNILDALELPSVRGGLNAAGLALISVGKVNSIPAIKAAFFEARAVADVTFSLCSTVSERTTYIEHTTLKQQDENSVVVRQTVVP